MGMKGRVCLIVLSLLSFCLLWHAGAWAQDCETAKEWFQSAEALSDNSEREAAYCRKAVELCPEYFEAHNRLGEIYLYRKEFDRAIASLKIAARKPYFAKPHKNLGEIYRMQGRYDLAVEAFTEAVKIMPDFREAQNQLKYVQKRLGRFAGTIDAPPEPMPSAIFTIMPGLALPKGAFIVNSAYRFMNRKAELEGLRLEPEPQFNQAGRESNVHVWIFGLRYGVSNDLTIGLIPKYFRKSSNVTIPTWGIDATPDVYGFGDTVVMTKYRVWGKRRSHFSVFNLLSIPTGDEDAIGQDGVIARRIPLGSGGYDFQPGLALTAELEPLTIHGNVSYLFTEGRSAGDEFRCDLAVAFPKWNDIVSLVELNYRWTGDSEREFIYQTRFGFDPGTPGATSGPNTQTATLYEEGGHTLFLSPGIQFFFTKDVRGELGVQVPIIRPKRGWVEDVVIHLGLTMYYF